MALVWSNVVAVAPELATGVSAAFQTLILGYVNEAVQADEFGGDESYTYVLAMAYLAAHYASLHKIGATGQSGPVTSMSEGGVSVGFANMFSSSGSPIGATSYGQAFLSFLRRSPANAGFVT
jgi:hypothetical protein